MLDTIAIISDLIAYGTAVTNEQVYTNHAAAGIATLAEPDSLVMVRRGMSLQRAYNEMLAEAAVHDDLEAVVFPHQDLRIADPDFAAKLRGVLADPSVAIVGTAGARGVRSAAWFEGSEGLGQLGIVIHGEVHKMGWQQPYEATEVDAVDGALLVLSAWAARNLRFDPRFEADFHGYDVDISFQARMRAKRVMIADIWALHEGLGKIGPKRGSWIRSILKFDAKWVTSPLLRVPAETYAQTPEQPFRVIRMREAIDRAVADEREQITAAASRSAPVPGAVERVPRVSLELDRSIRELWFARLDQHVNDSYAGVPLAKFPEDLRVYEHLIWSSRADTVVELGTYCGASALWLRDRLTTLGRYWGAQAPHVVTIDTVTGRALAHLERADPGYASAITVIEADVLDPELPQRVRGVLRPGSRCLVIEDSAHIYETTMAALTGFSQFVPENGFFVVEDTVCDREDLRVEGMPRGPLNALQDWLKTDRGAEFTPREDLQPYGMTTNPGGILERRRTGGLGRSEHGGNGRAA